jgi:hypothetical protein
VQNPGLFAAPAKRRHLTFIDVARRMALRETTLKALVYLGSQALIRTTTKVISS